MTQSRHSKKEELKGRGDGVGRRKIQGKCSQTQSWKTSLCSKRGVLITCIYCVLCGERSPAPDLEREGLSLSSALHRHTRCSPGSWRCCTDRQTAKIHMEKNPREGGKARSVRITLHSTLTTTCSRNPDKSASSLNYLQYKIRYKTYKKLQNLIALRSTKISDAQFPLPHV